MKTQPLVIFARLWTAKCTTNCNQDNSLEEDDCSILKVETSHSTLNHIFYLSKPLNIYRECDFVSSVSGNIMAKIYIFAVFKKDVFLMGGK